MLLQLNIRNFAIVRELEIDWQNGMTTITGETGAGKSIAIDALGLCLGERASTNTVRPGASKAELIATFDVNSNPLAHQWLQKHDLDADQECMLRRVISAEGRSKAYINGSQVPLTQLKEIGRLLINIHGQHDHQLIIKPSEQLQLVDSYSNHPQLLADVRHYYTFWKSLTAEFEQLRQSQTQREAKQQLLQYQVQELDEFNLQFDEFPTLEADYKRHSNAQGLIEQSQQAIFELCDNEQFNVLDSLHKVNDIVSSLSQIDAELTATSTLINDALIQIEEANQDIKRYYDHLELDPEAFSYIEQRYSQAIKLAQKHHVTPEKLPDFHQQLKSELTSITLDESRIEQIVLDIETAREHYLQAAKLLRESRQKFANQLSSLITSSMQELNMPHGRFEIVVNEKAQQQPSALGGDEIGFLVSMNPGQPLEAMYKVASGGELSRISLAMQVVLATKVVTPTLVFDEVDVGISGPTAATVGSKLRQLGESTQVICVTHLPQVASKGHQQLFVTKLTDGEHTETKVTELNHQGRVREIARLLAGNEITNSSLANAEELLAC